MRVVRRLPTEFAPAAQLRQTSDNPLQFETYLEECRYHLLTLDAYVRTLGAAGFRQIRMEDITTAFVGALRHEQERFVDNRETFLRECDENDYDYLIDRWDKKIRFCERGDFKWGLFVAMR